MDEFFCERAVLVEEAPVEARFKGSDFGESCG